MVPSEDQIVHVSDTALLVAACRALETAIPEGIIHDPFAERLAGSRGMAIATAFPELDLMRFGVGVRSRFVDGLVLDAVAEYGVQTVIILGCGLDSRPWRLDLPSSLRWIEADFPALLEYKSAVMAEVPARCRLERIAADLTDASRRDAIYSAVGNAPALMITEGLLMYLPAETVGAIAAESSAKSGIRYWLMDVASQEMDRRLGISSRQSIHNVRADGHLNGEQIMELQRRNGWKPFRHRSYVRESHEIAAARIQAMIAQGRLATDREIAPPPADDPSGVYVLGR